MWIGFGTFVLAMLALDLGVFRRKSHAVGLKESLTWSGVRIASALRFNAAAHSRQPSFCPWQNPVSAAATPC